MSKKAVLYLRYSPRPKIALANCESLENQIAYIEPYCQQSQFEIDSRFEDKAKSGKSLKSRPGLEAALQRVCELQGVLVVYSLSRLSRSLLDCINIMARLHKAGADVVSVKDRFVDTTSPMGRAVFQLFAVMGELERDLTIERISDGMNRRQAAGQRMSRYAPWGTQFDGDRIVPNEQERELAARIRAMYREHSSPVIKKMLEAEGVLCRGKPWQPSTILKIASEHVEHVPRTCL